MPDSKPLSLVERGGLGAAAGIFTTFFTHPFDVIRVQMQVGVSALECARTSVAADGVLVLWRGFVPAFVKLAPYTVISLTMLEKFTALYTGGASAL
ncbi:hypothetical protein EMIHUDRAFT_245609 [Emiliania huxleyi CCMP1516]|uniref:Mitochondrial carrier protein n=2 Tax=Emiliania huxleyi TaxID=2903 RepID=A0A0D3IWY8_EMIH1|nr:hypothetical protein EMIHUDRAFT_245609 [Emiliania huxleyi CCMP1516]EOD15773.1 hypothetical protein EMIHUDRAFT_245609 [Emiliania huxleyi CCMP1516]|eukprot:XP_005768202.1 hypothetical protein EMIHUDRAFT_245609 [Emiliania huxleyi CCMP1516]